jgi:hypothetical protein
MKASMPVLMPPCIKRCGALVFGALHCHQTDIEESRFALHRNQLLGGAHFGGQQFRLMVLM